MVSVVDLRSDIYLMIYGPNKLLLLKSNSNLLMKYFIVSHESNKPNWVFQYTSRNVNQVFAYVLENCGCRLGFYSDFYLDCWCLSW